MRELTLENESRQVYALVAMAGILSGKIAHMPESVAKLAYDIADAMVEESKKRNKF